MMNYITLSNGIKMPQLGYGVYQIPADDTERCVLDAISVGYRSIDTAQAYGTEEGVGNAIVKCGVPREELFITTKVWISNGGYERAKTSIQESLRKLQTEYIDLMLIHQPFNDYYGAYRAMEEAYKDGYIRAIGVANFYPDRLIDLCQFTEVPPMVNQVETHVFHQQKAAMEIMKKYNVKIMSWAPFAEGRKDYFTNPILHEIATKYGKTTAQIALRFLLEKGIILIPKSTHKERMAENFDIFGFSLEADDIAKIEALDEPESAFFSHYDPDTVEMLCARGKSK